MGCDHDVTDNNPDFYNPTAAVEKQPGGLVNRRQCAGAARAATYWLRLVSSKPASQNRITG